MKKHFECYNHDERSEGANIIFKSMWRLYKGDFTNILFISEVSKVHKFLEEHVRNIYEVIDTEIPMMAWINVLTNGHKGYTEWEDYESQSAALYEIEKWCHEHYRHKG